MKWFLNFHLTVWNFFDKNFRNPYILDQFNSNNYQANPCLCIMIYEPAEISFTYRYLPETWVEIPLIMWSPCPLALWPLYRPWTSHPISSSSSPSSQTWPAWSLWTFPTTSWNPSSTKPSMILKTAMFSKLCKFLNMLKITSKLNNRHTCFLFLPL